MSQQHRNNPGSEENQRMTHENEKAVLSAQMETWPECEECRSLTPPGEFVFGRCRNCIEEENDEH